MLRKRSIVWLLLFTAVPASRAVVIAGTSFENEAAATVSYATPDTSTALDPSVEVLLANQSAPDIVVNSTAASTAAGDLGFRSTWFNTRGLHGFTEGDLLGVREDQTFVGPYPDGTQGFSISDPQGDLVLTFDPVSLSGHAGVTVGVDLFLLDVGYEPDDFLLVEVKTDLGVTTLLDTRGTGIDGVVTEDEFFRVSALLSDEAVTATLVVTFSSNQNSELLAVDAVTFEAESVVLPEPAAVLVLVPVVAGGRGRGRPRST